MVNNPDFCVRLKNKRDFQSLDSLVSGAQMYAEQRNNAKKLDVKMQLVLNLESFSLVYCVLFSELHYGLNLAWSYTHKIQTWGVIPWHRYRMGALSLSGPWSRHRSFFREFFSWQRRKMKIYNQNKIKMGCSRVCRHVNSRQKWLPGNVVSERNQMFTSLKKETRFHSTMNNNNSITNKGIQKEFQTHLFKFTLFKLFHHKPFEVYIQIDWLEFQWCYLDNL